MRRKRKRISVREWRRRAQQRRQEIRDRYRTVYPHVDEHTLSNLELFGCLDNLPKDKNWK